MGASCAAIAQEGGDVGVHAQATWIGQIKPAFGAAYTRPISLQPQRETSNSFSTTLDLGISPWRGAQVHLNPEGVAGRALSGLTGLGAITNGELQRGSTPWLKTYRARFYIQQRLGTGEEESIDPDFDEVGGRAPERRWTLTVGTVSLLDFFDPNPYAKDPRKQFMNTALLTHGAWDYPGDEAGYTAAAILEWRTPTWAVRAGRSEQPRESNGAVLESNWHRQFGDQVEAETDLPVEAPGGPVRARVLYFRNRINAGSFSDALAAPGPGGVPDIAAVRRPQSKRGVGVTFEFPLAKDEGAYVRASRSSGRLETYSFQEIDSQVQVGSQFTGSRWGRAADRLGVAVALDGLSSSHRAYLAAGGTTAFLGDGALSYARERLVEAYYRWALASVAAGPVNVQSALSLGWQHVGHPGYNRDRGPVQVWSLRWHGEF